MATVGPRSPGTAVAARSQFLPLAEPDPGKVEAILGPGMPGLGRLALPLIPRTEQGKPGQMMSPPGDWSPQLARWSESARERLMMAAVQGEMAKHAPRNHARRQPVYIPQE